MTEVNKEMEELKAEIDKVIAPLQRRMDLYFSGHKELVDLELFIQQQFRVINFLREIHNTYSNDLAEALLENQKLRGAVLLSLVDNEPVTGYNVN